MFLLLQVHSLELLRLLANHALDGSFDSLTHTHRSSFLSFIPLLILLFICDSDSSSRSYEFSCGFFRVVCFNDLELAKDKCDVQDEVVHRIQW